MTRSLNDLKKDIAPKILKAAKIKTQKMLEQNVGAKNLSPKVGWVEARNPTNEI